MSDVGEIVGFLLARVGEQAAVGMFDPASLHTYDCAVRSPTPYSEPTCSCDGPARAAADVRTQQRVVAKCAEFAADYATSGEACAEQVLGLMAMRYDSHPDFRDEWRPCAIRHCLSRRYRVPSRSYPISPRVRLNAWF